MAVAGAAPLLVSVVELGEVAELDVGDEGRDDDEVGFSWNSFLMVMVPVADAEVVVADGDEAPPMGGNTIRMPEPGEFVAEFFGWRPTAFATALMIAALVGKVSAPEDGVPEGTGVVEPFVLLLLLVLTLQGAASDPPEDVCCAYSVLWIILTWAVMLSLRVNSLKQYGHG